MQRKKSGRRGIHSQPNEGITDEWLTPPELIQALGEFDLDPCAHPKQPWRTAKRMISPPRDGLACAWRGRVWLNPPYGNQTGLWLRRLVDYPDGGIALVPSRTEVIRWFWPFVWEAADSIFFFRGRIYFRKPDGGRKGNAGHGSVLAAYSAADTKAIEEAIADGKIKGRLFKL